MSYFKIGPVYLLLFVSLFIFTAPAAVRCAIEGQPANPEEAFEKNAPDTGEAGDEAEKAPERKIPQLAPGKWEPLFELGEDIYPSVVISTATLKQDLWEDKQHIGDPWGTIGIAVRGTKDDCPITVEISGGSFIKPSSFTGTLPEKGTVYCVYPALKYDYDKLLAVNQTVPEMLDFKVRIGDKTELERSVRVQVRPINECVYYFIDSSGNLNDTSFFFAAYVNENHPFINRILKDAIASKKVDSFSGYSGDRESVMEEIEAIWDTLKGRGMHYSTMAASADDDNPYLNSQYVRLLGESINYAQANCADGSVLMASIFRKIGLDASLIVLPDHMFVAVSLDAEGKETAYIETTYLSDSALEDAMEEGKSEYEENKDRFDSEKEEDEDYHITNIQAARVLGVMPIKDASVN